MHIGTKELMLIWLRSFSQLMPSLQNEHKWLYRASLSVLMDVSQTVVECQYPGGIWFNAASAAAVNSCTRNDRRFGNGAQDIRPYPVRFIWMNVSNVIVNGRFSFRGMCTNQSTVLCEECRNRFYPLKRLQLNSKIAVCDQHILLQQWIQCFCSTCNVFVKLKSLESLQDIKLDYNFIWLNITVFLCENPTGNSQYNFS